MSYDFKKFNSLLTKYQNLLEDNEHLTQPVEDRANIDAYTFTDLLVKELRTRNIFKKSDEYINFNDFIKTEDTKDGQKCTIHWFGYKGEYEVVVSKVDETFVVSINCNNDRLETPSNNTTSNWESYIQDIADFLDKQEQDAEAEKQQPKITDDFGAIEPTSTQPSALPGAPAPQQG